MIEIKGVNKVVGGSLRGVNLEIHKGEIIGLFGENGAGKSTLMKCILGLTKYNGEILIDGEKLSRKNVGKLSYASCENTFFPDMSMHEHRILYQEQFDTFNEARFEALLEFFELKPYIYRPLGWFSTGQKNQFETILALSQGAKYIFLDEPFTGNDLFNREDFYKVLISTLTDDETIVLSTHLIEETNNFISRLVLLKDGRVIKDKTIDEIEEAGLTAVEFVKQSYGYEEDRVVKALDKLTR